VEHWSIDALTSYVLGLTLTQPAGSEWQLAPQFGDLIHAEGGFTTPLGKFSASWTLINGGYTISWGAPNGTVGAIILSSVPGWNPLPKVELDGNFPAGDYDSMTGLLTINTTGGPHSGKALL
jgi:hypothetical protein